MSKVNAKPIELERLRAEMIFSSPVKAPPHTNRILQHVPAGVNRDSQFAAEERV